MNKSIGLACLILFSWLFANAQVWAQDVNVTAPEPVRAFDEGVPRTTAIARQNRLRPFGANLFDGRYTPRREDALDPNYRVRPGDRIAFRMVGEVTANEVLNVDSNGNVFIPNVGELNMVGTRSGDVSQRIRARVSRIYKVGPGGGVEVYANLLSASSTEVRIFVTGMVLRPGQYVGLPDDSVLAYLHQAGGVDPVRGSYRHIIVRRGKHRLAVVDLYDFLNNGNLPNVVFRDGDTIVVRPQGNMINVEGAARNDFRFEFLGQTINGAQLARYARPDSNVTNVALSGTRDGLPSSSYLDYAQFLRTRLFDGDTLRFVSDAPSPVIDISVEGSHLGNSYFAVRRNSRLQEVLDYISVNPSEASIENIYIKRKSVAVQQKRELESALRRLERSVLTAPARSDGEATIRAREAELVLQFVERASKVEPEGRVVVSDRGQVANIRLEDGDIIVIPAKSDVVTISGEVRVPQAVVYAANASIYDYIAQAGGYTDRANRETLVLVKPNGKVLFSENLRVETGDQIIIYPKVDTKDRQVLKDIVQIIFQIAVAAQAAGL